MKGFSITTILFVVAFGFAPAFTAPIPVLQYRDLAARAVEAQAVITWLNDKANSASINEKPICFYSGFTNTEQKVGAEVVKHKTEARGVLPSFIKARQCNTISQIIDKAHAKNQDAWSDKDWENVSAALAGAVAKPMVYVLLGQSVGDSSIWRKAELPTLKANKAVTTIEVWEIATDATFVKSSAKLK